MFTQENIGEGLALNKFLQNSKKTSIKQSLLQKHTFFKDLNQSVFKKQSFFKLASVKSIVNTFKQDLLPDEDIKRFAFYYAGKCLVQTLLLRHPKTPLIKLTEPKNNAVSSKNTLSTDLISGSEKMLFIETRINLESLLIGFYAGKVGEFFDSHTTQHTTQLKKRLFLRTTQSALLFSERSSPSEAAGAKLSMKKRSFLKVPELCSLTKRSFVSHGKIDQLLYQSDIGLSERVIATSLVNYILVNGSIYSPNFFNLQKNSILGNLNKTEILERKLFALFQSLEEKIKTVYDKQYRYNQTITNLFESKKITIISQKRETSTWCEEIVCKVLTFSRKPYGHWFRIYLPQIQTHQRQPASLDKFFTKSRELKLLPESTSVANSYHSRKLQNFALFKGLQKSNKALLCLSPIQPLPCMKLFAKTKLSENTVCVFNPSKGITKHSFFKAKISNLDEHSEKISTGLCGKLKFCTSLEKRLQTYLSPISKKNLFQSTYFKKAEFYTNFACNSSNIVTEKLVTKTPFSFDSWPQDFGHVYVENSSFAHQMSHNILLNTFSRAFNIIGKNRELLDILADHFIRFGKIRIPEILRICEFYVNIANFREQS